MYKKGTVVISVPLTLEDNRKLYELAAASAYKNKTRYAKRLLEQAIRNNFEQLEEGKRNGTQ